MRKHSSYIIFLEADPKAIIKLCRKVEDFEMIEPDGDCFHFKRAKDRYWTGGVINSLPHDQVYTDELFPEDIRAEIRRWHKPRAEFYLLGIDLEPAQGEGVRKLERLCKEAKIRYIGVLAKEEFYIRITAQSIS